MIDPDGSTPLEFYETCTELRVQRDGQCSVDAVKSTWAVAVARFVMCCLTALASLAMACIGLRMVIQSPDAHRMSVELVREEVSEDVGL